MYRLSPPVVYVADRATADARAGRRVAAMLAALPPATPVVPFADADIPELVRRHGWQGARRRQGELGAHSDPALVFTTLRFGDAPPVAPVVAQCPPGTSSWLISHLLGHGGRNVHREAPDSGRVCRSRYQFDTIYGCPHGCRYCHGGRVSVVFANVEEFVETQVVPTARAHPVQKVFMFNSALSDTLCFEPEYGMSRLLAEFFASTPDQYCLIHTKSANVDFLTALNHRGHTILLWSLTSDTVSRLVEPGSATTEQRIAAARRCQDAGYTVRIKFKPIIPVRGWRDEARRMIELLLTQVRPDNIGLCLVAWMPAAELKACLDVSLLDPACVEAMDAAAATLKGVVTGPFPPAVRAEVYAFYLDEIRKHNRDVPVFLCTESPELWREFAPRLGLRPADYACACGPQCVPGQRRIDSLWQPAAAG